MDKTCATCIENDDGLCDRKGTLVHDDDTCDQHKESWKDAILRQFCRQQEISEDGICSRCILYNNCPAITDSVPEEWKEIHYPRMTSNTTIEYLKDGKVQLITYGRSEDAEKAFMEMINNGI